VPPAASRRPGRPPAAKADETRKRILRAARLVFSERGYEGATFQAIAVRADLTRPAINHYFSSKRVLYREVVNQTNELVVVAAIKRAERETTLMGRLTAFISAAVRANSENPSASAFLVTNVLESQRHPELNPTENDAVRISREFLMRVVNDAIEHREVAADIDASALVETLLVVLCGVGFYAGYVRSHEEMLAVTDVLRQLLEGALWQPET
jgi:TetR/AcrR family transcriptional regulator, repressor for uid operon